MEHPDRYGVTIVMRAVPEGAVICPFCGPMTKEAVYAADSVEDPTQTRTTTEWRCSHYTVYFESLD